MVLLHVLEGQHRRSIQGGQKRRTHACVFNFNFVDRTGGENGRRNSDWRERGLGGDGNKGKEGGRGKETKKGGGRGTG